MQAPDYAMRGIYVSEFFGPDILGYRGSNRQNRPPKCALTGAST